MSQPRTTGRSEPLTEREFTEPLDLSGICDRPRLRLVRNTPPDEPSGSLLRRVSEGSFDALDGDGTGPSMADTGTAPSPLLRTLTQRPATSIRASAKTISVVRPEVVVPAAADPAVLVHVHGDLRLSLAQLSSETDTTLAARYVVIRLATGCVDLAPQDPVTTNDEGDQPGEDAPAFLTLRTDDRKRLVITRGILHRLAISVGEKLLVTLDPASGGLRLLNLATLADAVESCLAGSGDVSS